MTKQTCVMVTGMHRSGTSLHAGVLNILGANLGDGLLGPRSDVNSKGYFEHKKIMRNNQHLLETLSLDWDSLASLPNNWIERSNKYLEKAKVLVKQSFAEKEIFCIKDPRFCRLLPMWVKIFDDLGVNLLLVLCVRNPSDVVKSLYKRSKMKKSKAMRLWEIYNREMVENSTGLNRIFSHYDDLVDNVEISVNGIIKFVDNHNIKKYSDVRDDILEFVDRDLRHERLCNGLDENIQKLYNTLTSRLNVKHENKTKIH